MTCQDDADLAVGCFVAERRRAPAGSAENQDLWPLNVTDWDQSTLTLLT
jgi:hypothetical protein